MKIAAKVDDADLVYFKAEIEPLLDHPLIEFIGEIDERRNANFSERRGRSCFRSTGRSHLGWS